LMDRGIWATWYDLPEDGKDEYVQWLHEVYIPELLKRPGYLWGTHVKNLTPEERREGSSNRMVLHHTDLTGVPTGNQYLLLFGAESPHDFVDPSPAELLEAMSDRDKNMLDMRIEARTCILVEVDRVDGPEVASRGPGITPGPCVQLGTFNINALENEDELETWYARSRLPLIGRMKGAVGARKLVTISGWAKHAILYEFLSVEANKANFVDTDHEWSQEVVHNLVHAPGSPTLGERIWPS